MDKQTARVHLSRVLRMAVEGLKSFEWYDQHLHQYARQLYNGKIDDSIFLDDMISAISDQINRAWGEGMEANGLDRNADKTPEMEDRIQQLIDNEHNRVTDLIDYIDQQKDTQAGTAGIDSRVSMWSNRYNDVVNIAKLETAGDKDKLKWIYGDTEHCDVCASLNGIVASSAEWEQSGFHPQQPPNDLLTCGGWRCQCSLEPTTERKTAGALAKLMDLAVSHNV